MHTQITSKTVRMRVQIQVKLRWALFVTYTVIQSITSSETCSLHLTHPSEHTPGAVDTHTHTHLEQWTHTPGAVDTHTHAHTQTHTHTWSSGHTHTHTHTWSSGHTHTHAHTHTHTHTHTHLEQWTHTHTHLEQWAHTHTHTWSSGHTHTHTWSSGHTHTHTPGAVGTHTHTHLEQWAHTHTHTWSSGHTHTHTWSSGHTHTHTPGAVDTHTHTHTPGAVGTHTHTHLEQWTHTHTHLEQWAVRGAVGGSVPCSRVSPQSWTIPAGAEIRTHNFSPTLYPLGHDCPESDDNVTQMKRLLYSSSARSSTTSCFAFKLYWRRNMSDEVFLHRYNTRQWWLYILFMYLFICIILWQCLFVHIFKMYMQFYHISVLVILGHKMRNVALAASWNKISFLIFHFKYQICLCF